MLVNRHDPDYKVRREAVKQLGQSRNPEAVPYLIQALQDKTIAVKRLAIRGLGKLKDTQAIQPLITMLDDPNCNVHRPAYEELIRFGRKAVPDLVQALRHDSERIRCAAAYCLGEIKDPTAVLPLVQSLRDPAGTAAVAAARALQSLKDERTREPLAALLQDEGLSNAVKTNIALALGFLGDARAIPVLDAAYDRQPGGVVWIAAALSHIQDRRVIPVLQKIQASPGAIAQDCARHALQQLGFLEITPTDE